MWRYLKGAFFARVDVPGLGRVPINALAATGFLILGFASPGFWLLGLGAEAAVVTSLAFNKRFQRVIDAQDVQFARGDTEEKRRSLISILPPESQKRLARLSASCDRALGVYRDAQVDSFTISTNREALENLNWTFLKLLVAQFHLMASRNGSDERELGHKIAALERDLKDGEATQSLLRSKTATLEVLKKRLESMRRREQSLEEIDSDLTRVENQVALILENAAIDGKPQTIAADLQLSSDLLSGGLFGDAESAIADLDQRYSQSHSWRKSPIQEAT